MSLSRHRRAPRAARRLALAALLLAVQGCGTSSLRLPLNRPSLEPFRHLEQPRSDSGRVTVHFLGTTSLLFEDSATAILSDGFVTRPGALRVFLGRIGPDPARVRTALRKLGVDSLAAVFAIHSHYDHAMDAPVFARLTGAELVGSASTANVGHGLGLPARRMRVVRDGDTLRYGKFQLTFIESSHGPPDRVPGTVDAPLVPPARSSAWKSGTAWSVLVCHDEAGTALVHGSAGYRAGALRGRTADVVYLGISGLARQDSAFVDAYWDEVVRATGAGRVILVHWDDFSRGLHRPLRPMPYVADSFDRSVQRVLRLAAADGIEVLLPAAWRPTDPFRPASRADEGVRARPGSGRETPPPAPRPCGRRTRSPDH